MAKSSTARKSAEQLKSMVWKDQASALSDLRRAGMARRGEDYELRQHKPGSWQLVALNEAEPAPTDRESRVLASLRKKPGAKPRGEAAIILNAKPVGKSAPHQPIKAEAAVTANGRDHSEPVAPALTIRTPRVEKPILPSVKDQPVSLFASEAEPSVEPEAKPASLAHLYQPLPVEDGPYELVLCEGSGDWFVRHSAHSSALHLARRSGCAVLVRNKDGVLVRTYDWAQIRKTQKTEMPIKPRTGGTGKRASGDSKFDRAARLLFRAQGATAAELEKTCGWERVGQRHVNRASKFNDNARIEHLGDKHWRLVKRQG